MGETFWWLVAVAATVFLFIRRRRKAHAADTPHRDEDLPASPRRRPLVTPDEDSPWLRPEPHAASIPPNPRAAPKPDGIEEDISVILRRQIPPRDEPARSWLGGLPMLPDGVEWPRGVNPEKPSEGEVPLHFVGQICCEDLPENLWGGLGPREGWLLLFVNGNTCEQDNRGVWRILHTLELGSERQPPDDIGPIHDGVYTGRCDWTQNRALYPRWPLDCVTVPNELRIESQRSLAAPEDFEAVLYPGMPIQRDRHKLPQLPPISRRALAEGLRMLVARLSTDPEAFVMREDTAARFAQPDNFALVARVPRLAEEQARERLCKRVREELGDAATEEVLAERLAESPYIAKRSNERAAVEALLAETVSAAGVLERTQRDLEDFFAWRTEAREWLEQWRAELCQRPLDEPLDEGDQERVAMLLEAPPHRRWTIGHEGGVLDLPSYIGAVQTELSLGDWAREVWSSASRDLAVPYYLDPHLRYLIPQDVLPQFEAWWRSLYYNRPHRMGGYHDGVQSDAEPGPQQRLLLLQVATDDAMFFCWGDAGAIYAFIDPAALDRGDVDRAELQLECY